MVQTPLKNFIQTNNPNPSDDDIATDLATSIAVEDEINNLLQQQPVNLQALRNLARERNGYQNKSLRIRVWPKLFNINRYRLEDYKKYIYYFENFNSDYVEEKDEDEDFNEEEVRKDLEEKEKIRETKSLSNRKDKKKQPKKSDKDNISKTEPKDEREVSEKSEEADRQNSIKKLNPDLPILSNEEEKRIKENYLQIDCDVRRSLWGGPPSTVWTTSYREARRSELSGIIKALLGKFEGLYYYQGLHSLTSVILLTVQSPKLAFAIMCRLVTHTSLLTDFICQKDFELLAYTRLPIIVEIIKLFDPILYHHLVIKSNCRDFFFATSWIITWFSHDVSNIDEITWLFDILMTSPPATIYYIAAAYIVSIRTHLIETECDFAQIHAVFCGSVRRWGFPINDILILAETIQEKVNLARLLCHIPPPLFSKIQSKDSISLLKPIAFQPFADSDRELLENKRLEVADNLPLNGLLYRFFFFGFNPPTVSDTPLLYTHANYETVVKIRTRVEFSKGKSQPNSSKYPTYKLKYLTQVFSWKPKILFYFVLYQLRVLSLPILSRIYKKPSSVHPFDPSDSSGKKKKKSGINKTFLVSFAVALGSILTYSYFMKLKNKSH